jgi:hypothetical protein
MASKQSLEYDPSSPERRALADLFEEKRFVKLSNTARSISEIASQASLFIPMTIPSTLPSYVTLDPVSQWHVSGLLSTALESMTLPSRLKLQHESRKNLDQLASSLNINGNQNIAKLRMSIDQKSELSGHHKPGRLEVHAQSRDFRMPSQDRHIDELSQEEEDDPTTLDMEFFPAETREISRGRRSIKESHVFGQAVTYRAEENQNDKKVATEDEGYQRARRRVAGLPIIQK